MKKICTSLCTGKNNIQLTTANISQKNPQSLKCNFDSLLKRLKCRNMPSDIDTYI